MPRLNVVALISGGKDSFFSLLHCLANGHNLVALANLHPPDHAPEDMDSYMYQTVGHHLIPLYAEALGVPLYRGVIKGGQGKGGREYVYRGHSDDDDDDETEDLIPLLREVMRNHSEVDAICTGAILSTYQRTRIENIALRLRLTPLAFLWQYPFLPPYDQAGLLLDMAAVGQDSRIVKVASAGLDADKFLWRNVADPVTVARMKNAIRRFCVNGDGAVLGEGGEYETVTLDGPAGVWKGRVVVDGDGGYVVDGGEGVKARVIMKDGGDVGGRWVERLRIPSIWDDEFAALLRDEGSDDNGSGGGDDAGDEKLSPESSSSLPLPDHHTFAFQIPTNISSLADNGTIFTYANATAPADSPGSPQAQLSTIFSRLDTALADHGFRKSHITHCTLLLRSMSDFAAANKTYASYFSFTNPPARATVAIGELMPAPGASVMLSVIAHRLHPSSSSEGKENTRQGLHVQSQSYWAPANIGPYSQSISVPLSSHSISSSPSSPSSRGTHIREVHIAGQIPLVPASMELISSTASAPHTPSTTSTAATAKEDPQRRDDPQPFKPSVLLSLQHLTRIARCMHVSWWTHGVALIPYSANRAAQRRRVRLIYSTWAALHNRCFVSGKRSEGETADDEDVDPWDARNAGAGVFEERSCRANVPDLDCAAYFFPPPPPPSSTASSAADEGNGGGKPAAAATAAVRAPPCFVVEVAELPRGAQIEWCCGGVGSSRSGSAGSSSAALSVEVFVGGEEEEEDMGTTYTRVTCSPPPSSYDEIDEEEEAETKHADSNGSGGDDAHERKEGIYFSTVFPRSRAPTHRDASSFSSSSETAASAAAAAAAAAATRHIPLPHRETPNNPSDKKKRQKKEKKKKAYATMYTSVPYSPPSRPAPSPTAEAGEEENLASQKGIQYLPCYRVWASTHSATRGGLDMEEVDGVLVGRVV
ncbi:unnamed protein product [Periconia digitata]|uniref:Diphthine--ammonia ligase n=1 Tax=Periconia digitata TaxID=1303443 RepID=A0A9W4USN7_9PLEO|nr:unnamed protein product [Periconia digitata]